MKSYTAPLLFLFLVAYSRAWVQFSLSSWPYDEGKIDYLNDDNDKPKRSESTSSSESSFSSSSSSRSSSSSDSSGGFHVKMEEYEQKTDKSGTHEVTKTFEKKKATGGNETSSSKTVEVIRFPNGTIQRRVKENGPGMKAECTKSEDCGKDRYCNQLFYQCQPCINDFGCFNTDQCCGGKVCNLGKCITQPVRTGLAKSPCDDDNQCKTGLFCSYNVFGGGNCVELRKEGESCNKELFSRMRPNCTQGLECKPTRGLGFILNYKCLKPGSVGDKAASDSPFDWFTWRV